ncbi:MAG: hypothetical protein WAL83_03955 [Arenicellales bacterium]|jgi:hypothetical protein
MKQAAIDFENKPDEEPTAEQFLGQLREADREAFPPSSAKASIGGE